MSIEHGTTETSRRRFLRTGMALAATGVAVTAGLVTATAQPASAWEIQRGWCYCNRCYCLYYGGAGKCAAGGAHTGKPGDHTSYNYYIPYSRVPANDDEGMQFNWAWCPRCQAMTYAPGNGWCPGSGHHDLRAGLSWNYAMFFGGEGSTTYQKGWKYCQNCCNIAYAGSPAGPCAAGGRHNHSVTLDYGMSHNNFGN